MIDRNVPILSLVLRNAHGNWEKKIKKKEEEEKLNNEWMNVKFISKMTSIKYVICAYKDRRWVDVRLEIWECTLHLIASNEPYITPGYKNIVR